MKWVGSRIEWSNRAEREMSRLDPSVRDRIHRAVERFAETRVGDIARMQGKTDEFRLRVGQWRIVFHRDKIR